jgi:hypothetical protein
LHSLRNVQCKRKDCKRGGIVLQNFVKEYQCGKGGDVFNLKKLELFQRHCVTIFDTALRVTSATNEEALMDGNFVGLAAVVMIFGIPMAAMYTFFRVRKLRSEERMAAIARGVDVPMQPELSEAARSRRSGILLVAGAVGYIVTFVLIGRAEPDAMIAATFGVIPLAVGIGFFVDHALIQRDARAH